MKQILLIGEALIDRYNRDNKAIDKIGGAPANVAAAINKLGVTSHFVGMIGSDKEGNSIYKEFENFKLITKYLIRSNTPTTIANVTIDENGERDFTFIRGADAELKRSDFNDINVSNYDLIHLGSATAMLGGDLWESYKEVINEAKNNNVQISFDPNHRQALYENKEKEFIERSLFIIKHSTIVKVSIEEGELLTGKKSIEEISKDIINLGAKIVVITLGSKGTYVRQGNKETIVESIKVEQVDSTGAGDAFIGFLIGQYVLENNNVDFNKLSELIKVANIGAALSVKTIGALNSIPEMSEIKKYIK